MGLIFDDDHDEGQRAADAICEHDEFSEEEIARAERIARALEPIEIGPRPGKEGCEKWYSDMRERGLLPAPVQKRVELAGVVRKVTTQPAPAAPDGRLAELETRVSAASAHQLDVFAEGLIPILREFTARQLAPLLERIAALESRQAQGEGRIASIEAKRAKK